MWFLDSSGKLRRALVDSLGHFQVDVLTSPLQALVGEVQASPTTYTVLDRLKTLATLLNAGLPAALDTGALKVREQNPLASINVGNWPSDYPDTAVAKLLGAGLPSALTSDKLKVRASEIETLLGAGLPALLDTAALKVREQSPLTEVDVDIAKILNAAVSLTNYLPVGIAYPAGTLIDPRSIRALTSVDVVTVQQPAAREVFRTSLYRALPPVVKRYAATATAANNTIESDAVPTGKVWIVHSLCAYNNTSAMTTINATLISGTDLVNVLYKLGPLASERVFGQGGPYHLPAASYIQAVYIGCTTGDAIRLELNYTEVDVES